MAYYLAGESGKGIDLSNSNSNESQLSSTQKLAQTLWDLKSIQLSLASGLEVALGEVGFSVDQFQVMASISKLGSPTMGEISQDVNMPNASLSRIVDSLEDRALAFRLPNPEDRRRISVNLSDMGLDKFHQVLGAISSWQSAASNLVSDELAESLRSTAEKIARQQN
jgi:DNA-binding MarR family transcriptional regulator